MDRLVFSVNILHSCTGAKIRLISAIDAFIFDFAKAYSIINRECAMERLGLSNNEKFRSSGKISVQKYAFQYILTAISLSDQSKLNDPYVDY